jgi:glycerol-3-phosphate dehydrogenase
MFSATSPARPASRAAALDRLASEDLDVLVIGGGVTGCGCALDAVTRGLRVGLVEARDLAAGTSSRSSKLFHGGLRYLEQFNFALVFEALRERSLALNKLAPHLAKPVPFIYPLTRAVVHRSMQGSVSGYTTSLAPVGGCYDKRVAAERESQYQPDDLSAAAARLGAPDVRMGRVH